MRDAETGSRGRSSRNDRDHARTVPSEDVHVRNYDSQWGYDLDLEMTDWNDERVLSRQYYLQPGQVTGEHGLLAPGEYDITVELDNRRTETLRCRIGSAPEHTLLVEVGNGAVTLTEGLL